jgi:pyridoxine/pyridoxamine 5'-phosphate oxidase
MNIADIRTDYARAALDEEHTDADAVRQFTRWWDEARCANRTQ